MPDQEIFAYSLTYECGCDEEGDVPAYSKDGAENTLSKLNVCEDHQAPPETIEIK